MTKGQPEGGLTLVEVLLTLTLIGLVLLISSALLSGMGKLKGASLEGEAMVEGLAAFGELRRELREAVKIVTPVNSTFASHIEFTKVDPTINNRLPRQPALPTTRPASWQIHKPEHMLTVRYQMSGDSLTRQVASGAGLVTSSRVCEHVDAFSAALLSSDLLELRISFTKGQRLISFRTKIRRYLP